MTTLHIDPSELYPRETRPLPPKPGASTKEWKAFRSGCPLPLEEPKPKPKRKRLVENPTRRRPTKVTPEFVDQVRRLSKRGSDVATAIALHCSPVTVHSVRRRFQIPPFQRGRMPGAQIVSTPHWVPLDLINDFRARVRKHGQFVAASWVRNQLKKRVVPWTPKRDEKGRFIKGSQRDARETFKK